MEDRKRPITIALTKGRLAGKTLELFEKCGISSAGAMDKDTRKLIFENEERGIRFFLAKGPDVPTYVYYGAADIGVVGRDTILEENLKLYEVAEKVGYSDPKYFSRIFKEITGQLPTEYRRSVK